MWESLLLYLAAFASKWLAIVSAFALFVIEPMVRAYWPWGHRQLERLSPRSRTKIEIAVLIMAFFMQVFRRGTKNTRSGKMSTRRG
jgi:hypothetical protein